MFTLSRSLSLTCVSFGLLAACVEADEIVGEDLLARESEGIVQPVSMHPAFDDRGNPLPGTLAFEERRPARYHAPRARTTARV